MTRSHPSRWASNCSRSRKKSAPDTACPPSSRPANPSPPAAPAPAATASSSCRPVSAGDQAVDEVGQSGVEADDLARVGPLLRPVDSGCSLRPGQRVLHVTGDDDLGSAQVGHSGEVDGVDPPERAALGRHRLPGLVPEHRAEDGEHSRPAVGAGRPAERQDDPLRLELQCGTDGVAQPGRGGPQRGRRACGQGVQPAGVGDFDDGGDPVEGDRGRVAFPGGGGHVDLDGPEACRDRGGHAAVAAVGQRQPVVVDAALLQPAAQVVDHLGSGEAALELVGCDEDVHRVRPSLRASLSTVYGGSGVWCSWWRCGWYSSSSVVLSTASGLVVASSSAGQGRHGLAVQHAADPVGVDGPVPLADEQRRDGVADEVDHRAALGHELVDAEDQHDGRGRDGPDGAQGGGQRDEPTPATPAAPLEVSSMTAMRPSCWPT